MSITALSMIDRAMRLLSVKPVDAAPTAQEAADGLYALNAMLDAWGVERLMVYQVEELELPWPAVASRTIGNGGDFDMSRPVKIEEEGNFFRVNGLDYPVRLFPRFRYQQIIQKAAGGAFPDYLFYDDGFPLRTLYVYPVPSVPLTLHLNAWLSLQQFAELTDQINLPPGYQAAIEYSLTTWIAPEFGDSAMAKAAQIEKRASLLRAAIKSVNKPSMVSEIETSLYVRPSRIESDS